MDKQSESQLILAIVDSELLRAGAPADAPFLRRVVDVAKAADCAVELFHVCNDLPLSQRIFQLDPDVVQMREDQADTAATRLAEVAMELKPSGIECAADVRMGLPATEAILQRINETDPLLVMKAAGNHDFVVGLVGNTDWNLIRQSPTDVWLVKADSESDSTVTSNKKSIDRIVTAIGSPDNEDDVISARDYKIFETAKTIAQWFDADNIPVHAYQVPSDLAYTAYSPYIGSIPAAALPSRQLETQQKVAKEHGRLIEALAEFFEFDPDEVRIAQGHPGEIVPETARKEAADLIVMGARSLNRWERATRSVTAEPVIAEAPCDTLFVKEDAPERSAIDSALAVRGKPAVDIEQVLARPADSFNKPADVVRTDDISMRLRRRILEAWEHDERAKLVEDDEGGPIRRPSDSADTLQEILAAKADLEELASHRIM